MDTFAYIYLFLTVFVVVFQLSLALGAPLGEYTLGGKFPGQLPPKLRLAALLQIVFLLLFAAIVAARAEVALVEYHAMSRIGIWFVVAFFVLGSVVNLLSPSKKERRVMGPANIVALISTLIVAIS